MMYLPKKKREGESSHLLKIEASTILSFYRGKWDTERLCN